MYETISKSLNIDHVHIDDSDVNVIELEGHWGGRTPTTWTTENNMGGWNKGIPMTNDKKRKLEEGKRAYWQKKYDDGFVKKTYQRTGYNTRARSERAKERNKIQVECPHCGKTGQLANMKRWHFDNCGKPNKVIKDKNGRFSSSN